MQSGHRALTGCLSLVLCALSGCSATSVSTVWKSAEPGPARFSKVLALVLNASPVERRAAEDELVRCIRSVPAVASHTLVTDEDLKDKAKIRAAITGQGFDGAAVIRLVSTDTRTTYMPPQYVASYDPFNPVSPYGAVRPGYTVTDVILVSEVSLYSVKDDRLIWAGSSTTENPANIQDLVAQVARAAGEELRRQHVLP